MSSITVINSTDLITDSRAVINTNFSNLNSDKIESSYLDTDTTLAANSDTKIATQKAVKAYVDTGGNVNASETTKGIVEEATDAEVTAGTATGATGAKLFVTPAKLTTRLSSLLNTSKSFTATESITTGDAVIVGTGSDSIASNSNVPASTGTNTLSTTTWFSQNFTVTGSAKKIKSVRVNCNSGSVNNKADLLIYAIDGSNKPTGAALGSVLDFSMGSGASQDLTVTFSTPVTVTPSTNYAIVMRLSSSSTAPRYWNGGASNNSGGISTDSGATWTMDKGNQNYTIYEIRSVAGQVSKADPNIDGTTATPFSDNFIGFAQSSVSAGQSVSVVVSGIVSNLSGLTPGTTYYLSDTGGAITTSAGSISRKVGLAVSATELLIKHDNV